MAERTMWDLANRRERLFKRPTRRPRRGWIVLAVILVFVGVAWLWAFQRGPSTAPPGGVPLLRADNQPTRKRPDDPGGMKVADVDNAVFSGEKADGQVEHLLPPPESPLPRPAADVTNQATAVPSPPAPLPVAPPSPAATAPWASPSLHLAAASASGPPTPLVSGNPAPAAPDPPPQAKPKAETAQRAPTPPQVKPKAEASSRTKAPTQAKIDTAAPATRGRTFRLQLASVRSAAAAKDLWERMKGGKDADLLGGLGYSVVTANLGERGIYYRIVAGPLASDRATQTCEELKRRGAGCILVKP